MVTWVDKMLACDPQHLTVTRVRRIIEETILHYDPDRAVADEQAALAARHVTLDHDTGPATTEVHMRLDTLDALHLDDTLADLATGLRRLGDTDPHQAPHLLTTGELTPSTGGRVELYLHLDATDLTDPTDPTRGAGEIERLGAATRGCSPTGWAGPTWPGSPSARFWTCTPPRPWTGTIPRPGCGAPPSWPRPRACSPAAPATPGAATWTTSTPTSRSRTAAHRGRPGWPPWHRCAAPTTGSRLTAAGPTSA